MIKIIKRITPTLLLIVSMLLLTQSTFPHGGGGHGGGHGGWGGRGGWGWGGGYGLGLGLGYGLGWGYPYYGGYWGYPGWGYGGYYNDARYSEDKARYYAQKAKSAEKRARQAEDRVRKSRTTSHTRPHIQTIKSNNPHRVNSIVRQRSRAQYAPRGGTTTQDYRPEMLTIDGHRCYGFWNNGNYYATWFSNGVAYYWRDGLWRPWSDFWTIYPWWSDYADESDYQ